MNHVADDVPAAAEQDERASDPQHWNQKIQASSVFPTMEFGSANNGSACAV
jgi:hypothetical protein